MGSGDKKRKANNNKKGKELQEEPMITDERFKAAESDPRYMEVSTKKSKVAVDDRFSHRLFSGAPGFGTSKAPVDKRGKPIKNKRKAESSVLNHYYPEQKEEEEKKMAEEEEVDDKNMGSGDKKRKANNNKKRKEQRKEPMITDERFKAAESDMEVSTKKSKVALDTRFSDLFTGAPGIIVSKSGLNHYYPEQEEEEKKKKVEEEEEVDDSEEEDEEGLSGSDSEELKTAVEDDTDDTTDSESGADVEEEEEDAFELPVEDIPDIDKETRRLAVVNMDWTHVRAVDLFVTLSSFLQRDGQLKSVTVYPSEFGLKRMEEEAVHGPIALFNDDEKEKENEDEDDDEEVEEEEEVDDEKEDEIYDDDDDEQEDETDDDEQEDESEDDVNGIDKKKLRAYELSKLRYYFAVVECDSVATADYLYQTCDGVEFERSGNIMDLRFIPDSMEFKHPPRDVATEKPENYKGRNFRTRALQHSGDIQPTWDEDEPGRNEIITGLLKKSDQPAEWELDEILAPDDESETDADEIDDVENDKLQKKRKRQDKYLALIQSGNGSDEDDEEDTDQDMEITFNTGLEDISKRILENKDKKSETVWEATLRKKKEKKNGLRKRSKYSSDDESDDYDDADRETGEQPNDFFINDKQGHGIKEEESVKEAEKRKAELELLLTDVNGEKSKVKSMNKGKKDKDDPVEKLATIDYSDPRFSALSKNPNFALDPTDPQFKRSAGFTKLAVQKDTKDNKVDVRKTNDLVNSNVASEVGEVENLKNKTLAAKTKRSHELSTLVRSVKMKSKQMPVQSERKVQRNHRPKAKSQK